MLKDISQGADFSLTNQERVFSASLSLCALSIAAFLAAIYMKGERPFTVFLSSKPGIAFLCAIAVFFITGGIIAHQYLASRRSQFSRLRLIVMMNLVTVILIVVTSELIVRAGSQRSPYGEAFANRPLNPKNWERIKLRY